MTRVLLVEANEDGTVGGSHRIQHDLVTRLSSEYEPHVLFYQDNAWAGRLRDAGVKVHLWDEVRAVERAEMQRTGRVGTLRVLAGAIRTRRRFLREHGIDLVHLNNAPMIGEDDWLPACKLSGTPCVVYAMGPPVFTFTVWQRMLIRGFDRILPLSRFLWDGLVANRVDEGRLVLANPGVDCAVLESRAYRPSADVRRELGVREGQLLVAMIGNVREWKGQHVVVEALRRLEASARARLRVVFAGDIGHGDEAYFRSVEGAIREAGLTDVCSFVGHRDDVPDILEAADIALHASVLPEPFGLVVLEGLAHGCAMVAAAGGGPSEIVTPECGLLFDPQRPEELTDRLRTLVEDPVRVRALGQAGRRRARAFDVTRHVEVVEGVYRSVLGGVLGA